MYNVNVYSDYLNIISLEYYACFALFIILVHELVNYFEINIIPLYFL